MRMRMRRQQMQLARPEQQLPHQMPGLMMTSPPGCLRPSSCGVEMSEQVIRGSVLDGVGKMMPGRS
jgi:hypothetical protein